MLLKKLNISQNLINLLNKQNIRNSALSGIQQKHLATQTSQETIADTAKHTQLTQFSPTQAAKILEKINSKDVRELQCYDITKARAQKLHQWRKRNGPLKDIQDILYVESFSLKIIEKFYKSLLQQPNNTSDKQLKPARTAPFITPSLAPEQRHKIRSSLAVRIGVASVTWARLSIPADGVKAPSELTDWQHHDILDKKLHLHDLVQRCIYINHLIPEADCYIFENPQMAQMSSNPGSVEQQNINIQKAQLQAMMSFALAERLKGAIAESEANEEHTLSSNKPSSAHSNVFYVRRFLTARLFNHLVGTERVSSEDTIINLMRTYYNMDDEAANDNNEDAQDSAPSPIPDTFDSSILRGNVQFPRNFRQLFSEAERYHREYLGQALLLNLAFLRLVLLQDPQSIAQVTRTSNKDKVDVNVA